MEIKELNMGQLYRHGDRFIYNGKIYEVSSYIYRTHMEYIRGADILKDDFRFFEVKK